VNVSIRLLYPESADVVENDRIDEMDWSGDRETGVEGIDGLVREDVRMEVVVGRRLREENARDRDIAGVGGIVERGDGVLNWRVGVRLMVVNALQRHRQSSASRDTVQSSSPSTRDVMHADS
jgi:hypothetical protein